MCSRKETFGSSKEEKVYMRNSWVLIHKKEGRIYLRLHTMYEQCWKVIQKSLVLCSITFRVNVAFHMNRFWFLLGIMLASLSYIAWDMLLLLMHLFWLLFSRFWGNYFGGSSTTMPLCLNHGIGWGGKEEGLFINKSPFIVSRNWEKHFALHSYRKKANRLQPIMSPCKINAKQINRIWIPKVLPKHSFMV